MSQEPDRFRVDAETMARLQSAVETDVDERVTVCKALADERRMQILRLLDTTELCVCDLVEIFDVEYSKLSYHLKQLRDAGLVSTDREGNYVTYHLTEVGRETLDGLADVG
ncbi:MAG: ArsR/SmtB family transcription factor [Halobacteriota archaeon]